VVIRKAACKYGHLLTEANSYIYERKGTRAGTFKVMCRICHREAQNRRWQKDRLFRAAARAARIEDWKRNISRTDLAWAAGHFEGKGTISISSTGHGGYARPHASLASTDRQVIDLFSTWWPTSIAGKKLRFRTPNSKAVYRWEINSASKVRAFIDQIRPHLRTERCRAKFALVSEFTDLILAPHIGRTRPRHPEYIDAIRRLNHRGQLLLPSGETILDAITETKLVSAPTYN
jgi:hypothetical protein